METCYSCGEAARFEIAVAAGGNRNLRTMQPGFAFAPCSTKTPACL
jgi:hypothetical protein